MDLVRRRREGYAPVPMSTPRLFSWLALVPLAAGCGAAWDQYESELPRTPGKVVPEDVWARDGGAPPEAPPPPMLVADAGAGGPRTTLDLAEPDVFRNTYYDFPSDRGGAADATLFDAACAPLARVSRVFHDQVCVQGSGRLSTGETVSFAKRDCGCAAECPRTGQHICFERLDPARFPHGRGATGKPITPLRTVAVDVSVIPLGTPLFVPEYAGLPRPDGSLHGGCFVAEDRGVKVVGRQIDVFTGDPDVTARWNALVPSNRGVHVLINDAHCREGKP
jgi:3D (Asp-Asp-Asp) domain-containing protein